MWIEAVDHVMGPAMFDAMCPWLELPSVLYDTIRNDLFRLDYLATTNKDDLMKVQGTVLSGHPTLTTLFNTTRNIFYQEYAFAMAGT